MTYGSVQSFGSCTVNAAIILRYLVGHLEYHCRISYPPPPPPPPPPRQNGHHFCRPDDIFKCIFLNENKEIDRIMIQILLNFGTEQTTSHYMNQWWPSSLTHICGTGGGVGWRWWWGEVVVMVVVVGWGWGWAVSLIISHWATVCKLLVITENADASWCKPQLVKEKCPRRKLERKYNKAKSGVDKERLDHQRNFHNHLLTQTKQDYLNQDWHCRIFQRFQ